LEQDETGVFTLTDQKFLHTAGMQYYSLTDGTKLKLSDKSTKKWDIAMGRYTSPSYLFVYTNSGITATELGTGGQGGVWFTDTTDFNSVTSASGRVTDFSGVYAEYEPYTKDVHRWIQGMNGVSKQRLNIITYYGYPSGNGLTEASHFGMDEENEEMIFFTYDKRAAYKGIGGMPPQYEPTQQVYIIGNPDGITFFKFQIVKIAVSGQSYAVDFKFAKLD
jgi:hypothetical protein